MTVLTRRQLIAAGAGITALSAIDAFALEPRWLDVTTHDVPVARLPESLDGFSIAQITDAHLTGFGALEEQLVAEIRRRRVQLVVLTGDIVDSVARLPALADLCDQLRALRVTVLATLGNWEHWGKVPIEALARTYGASGATLLVNEFHSLEGAIGIVATDDSTGGTVSLSRGLAQRASAASSLLLTHSPELLDRLPRDLRFDLALAGHTHGGQITLGSYAPVLPPGSRRFVAGRYEISSGFAYVSRGTGTSLLPARFTCRPELPIFRLRRG